MQGSDSYVGMEPYPSYGPVREHNVVLPSFSPSRSDIVERLEVRVAMLETQVGVLQETVDGWEQWYHQWNPLFRLLHWMFGFMLHRNSNAG